MEFSYREEACSSRSYVATKRDLKQESVGAWSVAARKPKSRLDGRLEFHPLFESNYMILYDFTQEWRSSDFPNCVSRNCVEKNDRFVKRAVDSLCWWAL